MTQNASNRFQQIAKATLLEVGCNESVIESLLGDARELGLPETEAVAIIESLVSSAELMMPVDIDIAYDHGIANAGVAGGTTLIVFMLTNVSARSLASVVVHVKDAAGDILVTAPAIASLHPSTSRETEVTLALTRIGRQTIRTGFIEVTRVSGATAAFRLIDPILLTVEHSSGARVSVHTINQTIQTHGGGVVSTGDLNVAVPLSGNGTNSARWTSLRIKPATEADIAEFHALCAATAWEEHRAMLRKAQAVDIDHDESPQIPAAPQNLIAMPQSPTSVLLTWTDRATNEDGTHVERSLDGLGFTLMATLAADSTSYVATGLNPGTPCAFRIRTFNTCGVSPYSNVASVVLPALPKVVDVPNQPPIQVVVSARMKVPGSNVPESAPTGSRITTLLVNLVAAFFVIGCLLTVFQYLGFAIR
jgi:hypothetical protein